MKTPNPTPVPEKENPLEELNRLMKRANDQINSGIPQQQRVIRKNRTTESQSFNEGYLKALGDVETYLYFAQRGKEMLDFKSKLEELRKGK